MLLFLIKHYRNNSIKVHIGIPHFLWTGYILFSAISVTNAYNTTDALFELTKLLLVFALLLTFQSIFATQSISAHFISRIITLVTSFQVLIGYIQKLTTLNLFNSNLNQLGTLTHPNQYSVHLLLALPFVIFNTIQSKGKEKIASSLILSFMTIMFLLSKTRSVWVALAIMLLCTIIYIVRNKNITASLSRYLKLHSRAISLWILFTITLGAISIASDIKDISQHVTDLAEAQSSGRFMLWGYSWNMIQEHPFLGVGIGNWKLNIPVHGSTFYQRPHNDFLWILSESGPFALLSYIFFIGYLLKSLYHSIRNKAQVLTNLEIPIMLMLIGFISVSQFTFPKERILHLLYFSLATSYVLSKNNSKFSLTIKASHILIFSFILTAGITWFGYNRLMNEYSFKNINPDTTSCESYSNINHFFYNMDQTSTPIDFYTGLCYLNQKKMRKANKHFLIAHTLYPMHIDNHLNLATSYGFLKEYQSGVNSFIKLLDIYPHSNKALINLAVLNYHLNEVQKIRSTLERVDLSKLSGDLKSTYDMLLSITH
ncbi:MAG: O-antigen ligase family protein [Fibrobacterales bacterium]